MPDPFGIIHGQHESAADVQARLRRESFRVDPQMENLARLKADQPQAYDRLPATQRIALGTYLASKQAAATGEPVRSMTFPSNDAA